ncbi:MAG: thiamine phosphate synthase [Verrucomicrobiota bacterium]|jgi:thiamine-phosphate pyrophosphorylase
MKPISDALLYGILDMGYVREGELERVCDRMLEGGVDVLQLRAKGVSEEEVEQLAGRVVALTEAAGVPLILNDHPALVPSVGAQGAHVGQEDFAVEDARWRAGRALAGEVTLPLIGKSTHSVEQAVAAAAEGADYLGFGPLFPTPTKAGRPAIGLEQIAEVYRRVDRPVFCIGGIKRENLERVLAAGARRVVIVSGILQAADIAGYCREVRAELAARLGGA